MEKRNDEVICSANLARGMRYWHEKKKNWPRDFHRQFYLDMASSRADGITEQWWRVVVPHLVGWKATRPLSGVELHKRGLDKLASLKFEYDAVIGRIGTSTPEFTMLKWEDIADFYSIAHSVKGMKPPMFGSKLCHFLIPGAFPVIDGDAVGFRGHGYAGYWHWCQSAWGARNEKASLIAQLREGIGGGVGDDYPWGPKIAELCLIGQKASLKT